ncbi:MAG: alkaline shock response membrane anchor protein AmaP [Clostridia bacterium]|nr:alkaline shock response membrane anchor protein AmaP [Clostridia bacterium]
MKFGVKRRLLVAVAGVLSLCLAASMVAEMGFNIPVTEGLHGILTQRSALSVVISAFLIILCVAVGVACICLAFAKKTPRGFIAQSAEGGEMYISMEAMGSLVQKCIDTHEELDVTNVSMYNDRNGLVIELDANLISGINIPLTVNSIQKQIREYVQACSGVDVADVNVKVHESNDPKNGMPAGAYTMPDPSTMLPKTQAMQTENVSGDTEEDEKPLHQRLFSHPDVEMMVPLQPASEAASDEDEQNAEDTDENNSVDHMTTDDVDVDLEDAEDEVDDTEASDSIDSSDQADETDEDDQAEDVQEDDFESSAAETDDEEESSDGFRDEDADRGNSSSWWNA